LHSTKEHWAGWFEGMTKSLLSHDIPKLVLVPNKMNLDREIRAQIDQGKIKSAIIDQAGHGIMEDQPDRVASVLSVFW